MTGVELDRGGGIADANVMHLVWNARIVIELERDRAVVAAQCVGADFFAHRRIISGRNHNWTVVRGQAGEGVVDRNLGGIGWR